MKKRKMKGRKAVVELVLSFPFLKVEHRLFCREILEISLLFVSVNRYFATREASDQPSISEINWFGFIYKIRNSYIQQGRAI
jgi:hypothetical protein